MVIHGKSASKGIAIGPVVRFSSREYQPALRSISDTDSELERFSLARDSLKRRITECIRKYETLEDASLKSASDILNAHLILLDDPEFFDCVCELIRSKKVTAEFALAQTRDHFVGLLSSVSDEYLSGRAADIKDLADQMLSELSNSAESMKSDSLTSPSVILANDLTPSRILSVDRSLILAIALKEGSVNSHTAILARSMNIPMIVCMEEGLDFFKISTDREASNKAIVDGELGLLILNPSADQQDNYRIRMKEYKEEASSLISFLSKETISPSGKKISVFANMGDLADLPLVLANDAEGIGLFRSEFLFLNTETNPSEEEQFQTYRKVLEAMPRKKVIIRTMDLGADKTAASLQTGKEENPALGLRGIRLSFQYPQIFKVQLRALLRAGCYGNLAVMFPMITSVSEVKQIKKYIAESKESLAAEGIPFSCFSLGVMIETPAAALISDELAKEVDFFSIGTNDLTQYTLAADRQNEDLQNYFDPHHPALMRLIELTVRNAKKENCRVGICGELAADLSLTDTFLKLGIDELSVTPGMVLPLRRKICTGK